MCASVKTVREPNTSLDSLPAPHAVEMQNQSSAKVDRATQRDTIDYVETEWQEADVVDVFIIGGGPGGYVAAIKASQLGLSVALAEQADIGGTCTNWGCIPTKTMLASSKLLTRMQEARKFGLTAEGVGADFGAIMTRKDQVVVRLRKGIEYLMKKNNVQVYADRATLHDATHVCIGNTGEVVETKNVIIATGSSPIKFPPFTDPGIWTSDDVFRNREQPKELVVIGGGVIGVEMATFFSAIGTRVTIVELMPHILPAEDEDLAMALTATLKKRGITIITGAKTQSVTPSESGYVLTLDANGTTQEVRGDHVLLPSDAGRMWGRNSSRWA